MGDQTNPTTAPPAANEGGNATIPLPRFKEVNDRMKAAEARVAELEARLQPGTAPSQPAAPPTQPSADMTPEAPTATPQVTTEPSSKVTIDPAIEQKFMLVKQGVPVAAVDEVHALVAKGYDVEDAIMVAQRKNPGAFGKDSRGFNPAAHAAAPPASGRPPAPPAPPTELEQIAATRDLHKRSDMAVKAAGKAIMAHIMRARS